MAPHSLRVVGMWLSGGVQGQMTLEQKRKQKKKCLCFSVRSRAATAPHSLRVVGMWLSGGVNNKLVSFFFTSGPFFFLVEQQTTLVSFSWRIK